MDTQILNSMIEKEKAKEKLAKERAEFLLQYQQFYREFHTAIENHAPQEEINLLRKRLNNARVRITPWLKEEKSTNEFKPTYVNGKPDNRPRDDVLEKWIGYYKVSYANLKRRWANSATTRST